MGESEKVSDPERTDTGIARETRAGTEIGELPPCPSLRISHIYTEEV